ncbi:hypothetical protein SEA_LILBEANIE_9 [Gordonia phage Lilbeanie]|uniref:Uncharacterized protein n=1 Tax=Gordonia phage Lilbeanie TaxID=2794947 RepID=A0A7T1NXQ0_9CAUD|nr:hypothetical protein J1773_gp09 [Gordonia phage Lilbeanie]QPO17087.1 hypothetical protein SEA_LILBEANIE_9 [Gordonia phage Lilbeanie]
MFSITQAQVDEAIQESGSDDDDVRASYSGRAMFGRGCLGYTGTYPTQFAFWLAVQIAKVDTGSESPDSYEIANALSEMEEPRVDSLGRGTIYYWPEITVEED